MRAAMCRRRDAYVFTSLVAVPKAAAHHDHNTKAREDQVWRTREVPAMQPEAVTERVG